MDECRSDRRMTAKVSIRIPGKRYLIKQHMEYERKMLELKETYAATEEAYKKWVLLNPEVYGEEEL